MTLSKLYYLLILFGLASGHLDTDPMVSEISKIKAQLLAQHKTVWGDIHFSNSTNISSDASDQVAWQWGFWPLTSVT